MRQTDRQAHCAGWAQRPVEFWLAAKVEKRGADWPRGTGGSAAEEPSSPRSPRLASILDSRTLPPDRAGVPGWPRRRPHVHVRSASPLDGVFAVVPRRQRQAWPQPRSRTSGRSLARGRRRRTLALGDGRSALGDAPASHVAEPQCVERFVAGVTTAWMRSKTARISVLRPACSLAWPTRNRASLAPARRVAVGLPAPRRSQFARAGARCRARRVRAAVGEHPTHVDGRLRQAPERETP